MDDLVLPEKILTEAHFTQIENARKINQWAQNQLDLAERAGVPVAHHREKLAKAMDKITGLAQVYFPGR